MKKITLLCVGLSLCFTSWGQKIKVHESRESIGGGSNNALVVTIYGADENDVEKEWKSMMKDYGAKVSNQKGEMFANNAVIKDMGPKTMDIYTRFTEKKGEIEMVVGFDLGGAYMSSSMHADKYKIAEKILHDFAVKMTTEALNDQIKTQQKALSKLQDQEKDLEKDQKNQNSDIADYQNRIKKAQDAIEKDKDAQGKKQTEISNQQQVVDDLTKKSKAVE
ncbi:MAG TPA: hypothetical protein VK806_12185 [Bacteroidia bacterium]|nr:hypothetical protein [Bacteroidia bacterium]